MRSFALQLILVLLFLVPVILLSIYSEPITLLADQLSGMNVVSYAVYVLILVIAVVAMPVTVMPLIPVASALLGPLATSLLSIVGWTIGAAIAFLVARYVGRPVLEKFVSLEKVDTIAAQIPEETRFLVIVLLRLTLPVDVLSYALGLSKSIGFVEYIAATFIGVIWFSFAFAYLGDALLEKNTLLLIELGAVSTAIFASGWYALRLTHRKKNVTKE